MQNAVHQRVAQIVARSTALVAAMSVALLWCDAAHAQAVRKCKIDGRVVFQASPCPPETQAAAVLPAKATAAEPAAAPKKKTLADILRERDGADAGRAPQREAQGDGANVLRSRMGAV
jgi:hypothetical protein